VTPEAVVVVTDDAPDEAGSEATEVHADRAEAEAEHADDAAERADEAANEAEQAAEEAAEVADDAEVSAEVASDAAVIAVSSNAEVLAAIDALPGRIAEAIRGAQEGHAEQVHELVEQETTEPEADETPASTHWWWRPWW